jgi:hypothetical protein
MVAQLHEKLAVIGAPEPPLGVVDSSVEKVTAYAKIGIRSAKPPKMQANFKTVFLNFILAPRVNRLRGFMSKKGVDISKAVSPVSPLLALH